MNRDFCSFGVAGDVGERLLHDAEQVRFGFVRQTTRELGLVIDLDTSALAKSVGEPAESRVQTEIVEDGRPQEMGELANVGDGCVDQLDAVVNLYTIGSV